MNIQELLEQNYIQLIMMRNQQNYHIFMDIHIKNK